MDRNAIREVLLRCLRADAEREWGEIASAFKAFSDEDWRQFLRELGGFKLSPLFYWKLKSRAAEVEIPVEIFQKMRDAYLSNWARNARFFHALKNVLAAFQDAGISVITLKGAHIAALIYRDVGARAMVDVDLLVHEADLPKVDRVMLGLGYEPREPHRLVSPEGHEFHYRLKNPPVPIEVHWKLISSSYAFRIDAETLWKYSHAHEIEGVRAFALSPEDLLLHVSVHMSIHMFLNGLRDLSDVAQILRVHAGRLDWVRVLSQAGEWGVEKCVHMTLLLAARLLNAAIPERVFASLSPGGFDESYYEAAKNAVLSPRRAALESPFLTPNLVLMFGKKGVRAKAGLLAKKMLPSRAALTAFYGVSPRSPLLPIFYLKWMAAVIGRNAPAAMRLLFPNVKGSASETGADLAPLMNWLISR